LSPRLIDCRAALKHHFDVNGDVHIDKWNEEWTRTMMKLSIDRKTGDVQGYAFNNAS
jgi:hypothetical protein